MIRPFVQGDSKPGRRQGRQYVAVLATAHVVTAGIVVSMLYLFGTFTFAYLPLDVRVGAVGVAAVAGVAVDIRAYLRKRFTVCLARQTPKELAADPKRHWWLTPMFWGIDTGLLVTTYRVSFSSWVVLFAALLVVAPPWIGLLYAASFAVPLVVTMFLGDPARFGRSGSRARVWRPRLAQMAGVAAMLVLPVWFVWTLYAA